MQEGDERKGRRKSIGKRRRSRESDNRKEKRNEGPRNSLRSLPSGLVLARSLLLLSRLFLFFSPAAVLSTLSSKYDRRHVFARARVHLPPCMRASNLRVFG